MLRTLALLVFLPGGLLGPAVLAQHGEVIHRLEIRDGRVYHDGVELPHSALPDGFDAGEMTFTFEYAGSVMPALTLNGEVFALEDGRLVRLEEAAEEGTARPVAVVSPDRAEARQSEARRQAQEAYLRTLSERDRALYERLMEERDREDETLRLAYTLRHTADAAERERLRAELRAQLEIIFELKQENRRDEIHQGEHMIEEMRRQLAERERRRDEIIDHRLRELVGSD